LRRRVIAASVALFIALFGGITIQLASGHDPALKSQSSGATTTTSSGTSTTTPSGTTSSAGQQASPTTLAPVTTSQS
jgi:hypothetical protein